MNPRNTDLPFENEDEREALEEVMRGLDRALEGEAEELLAEGRGLVDEELARASAQQWEVIAAQAPGEAGSTASVRGRFGWVSRLAAAGLLIALGGLVWSWIDGEATPAKPGSGSSAPILLGDSPVEPGEEPPLRHEPGPDGWGRFTWDLPVPPGGWFELTVSDSATGRTLLYLDTHEESFYQPTRAQREAWPQAIQFSVQPTNGVLQVGEALDVQFTLSED